MFDVTVSTKNESIIEKEVTQDLSESRDYLERGEDEEKLSSCWCPLNTNSKRCTDSLKCAQSQQYEDPEELNIGEWTVTNDDKNTMTKVKEENDFFYSNIQITDRKYKSTASKIPNNCIPNGNYKYRKV